MTGLESTHKRKLRKMAKYLLPGDYCFCFY